MVVATSNFLLPNATIIVEVVAFAIVFFIIAKYVLPPINKAIQQRQEHISDSLSVIDQAKVQKAEAQSAYDDALAKARDDARAVIEQANTMAEEIRAEARDKGQAEYERLVGRAAQDIEGARQAAAQELERRVGELAVSIAGQVLDVELDAARHGELIERAINAVEAKV